LKYVRNVLRQTFLRIFTKCKTKKCFTVYEFRDSKRQFR
jgi:hypothetical protein